MWSSGVALLSGLQPRRRQDRAEGQGSGESLGAGIELVPEVQESSAPP